MKALQKLASLTALLALFTFGAMAQTASLEGEVKGEDRRGLRLNRRGVRGIHAQRRQVVRGEQREEVAGDLRGSTHCPVRWR